ncbi:MAG: hypothetical protein JWP32_760 [Schumannella sp.]|jgi:hypothetical protein|nr:hypothetical protein [Schumannella sp.]
MSATGEIRVVGAGWDVESYSLVDLWKRRRADRAERRAIEALERRAELAERLALEEELQSFKRVFERNAALARIYRG